MLLQLCDRCDIAYHIIVPTSTRIVRLTLCRFPWYTLRRSRWMRALWNTSPMLSQRARSRRLGIGNIRTAWSASINSSKMVLTDIPIKLLSPCPILTKTMVTLGSAPLSVSVLDLALSTHLTSPTAFRQLLLASNYAATKLYQSHLLPQRNQQNKGDQLIVGLLAASSLDFLINWLAILRLGCAALLIAYACAFASCV